MHSSILIFGKKPIARGKGKKLSLSANFGLESRKVKHLNAMKKRNERTIFLLGLHELFLLLQIFPYLRRNSYSTQLKWVTVQRLHDIVVERLKETDYTVLLAIKMRMAACAMLNSAHSKSRSCDLSAFLQCWNLMDCTKLAAISQTVLPFFLGKWVHVSSGMPRLSTLRFDHGSLDNLGTTVAESRTVEKYLGLTTPSNQHV